MAAICERCGADITGVALANLTNDTFEAIYCAWLAFGVLRFRAQTLGKALLQISASVSGPLSKFPTGG